MKRQAKDKKKWSKHYYQAKIGTWNCWSLSNERYSYCKELNYDILGLTELHNTQAKEQFQGKTWIHSEIAKTDAQGRCNDPAAGVAIMLSAKMANKVIGSGYVGTRIAWVRIKGPVCNLMYVVTYVPHKGRTEAPKAEDTIQQLAQLLRTARKSECVIIAGDLNCQLQRNVQGCTGQWSMTKHANKGHGDRILDMMRSHDLCAIDTYFKPKRKKWGDNHRYCNATYMPKDTTRRPTKLDYILISNRWKSMVMNVETRWGPSIHRFGHQFDHALVSATWRWRTKKTQKTRRPDFTTMSKERWAAFDDDLRIKLSERTRERYPTIEADTSKPERNNDTGNERVYTRLSRAIKETIDKVVPDKTWNKKNGRIVSDETKALYEKRARQYQKEKPTKEARKKWRNKIRAAGKKDYRTWVTRCTERIEQADNRGDSKAIYAEVKRLSGLVSRSANTRPTTELQEQGENESEELAEKKGKETVENTRKDEAEAKEQAGERGKVTDKNTRNEEPQELAGECKVTESNRSRHAAAGSPPPGKHDRSFEANSPPAARARIDNPEELAIN